MQADLRWNPVYCSVESMADSTCSCTPLRVNPPFPVGNRHARGVFSAAYSAIWVSAQIKNVVKRKTVHSLMKDAFNKLLDHFVPNLAKYRESPSTQNFLAKFTEFYESLNDKDVLANLIHRVEHEGWVTDFVQRHCAHFDEDTRNEISHYISYELRIARYNLGDIRVITLLSSFPLPTDLPSPWSDIAHGAIARVRQYKKALLALGSLVTLFVIFWILFGLELERKPVKDIVVGVVVVLLLNRVFAMGVAAAFNLCLRDHVKICETALKYSRWLPGLAEIAPLVDGVRFMISCCDNLELPRSEWNKGYKMATFGASVLGGAILTTAVLAAA